MEQTARIEMMENILDDSSAILETVEKALDKLEKNSTAYRRLREYYGSEEWHKDMQAADVDMLPEGLKCGVLTEDAVYDLIGDYNRVAVRMLEIATQMIKDC